MPEDYTLHILKVFFAGIRETLFYKVSAEVADRISKLLDEEDLDSLGFCWFSTLDGKDVLVRLSRIQLVHFLWEVIPAAIDPEEDIGFSIALRGKRKPFCIAVDKAEEAYDFFAFMGMALDHGEKFAIIRSEDGETVRVRVDQVVYVEASSELIRDGRLAADEKSNGDTELSDE